MCRSSSYTQHQIAWNKWIITVTMYSIQARRSAPTYLVINKPQNYVHTYYYEPQIFFEIHAHEKTIKFCQVTGWISLFFKRKWPFQLKRKSHIYREGQRAQKTLAARLKTMWLVESQRRLDGDVIIAHILKLKIPSPTESVVMIAITTLYVTN